MFTINLNNIIVVNHADANTAGHIWNKIVNDDINNFISTCAILIDELTGEVIELIDIVR